MKLTRKQRRMFPLIQRKYPVSVEFLKYNRENIWNFCCYALSPRLVIKTIAIRKQRTQRVFLRYHHLRRVIFDQTQRKRIKSRKRSVQQWSRAMVVYLKTTYGIDEFVESVYENDRTEVVRINKRPIEVVAVEEQKEEPVPNVPAVQLAPEEVNKQLKEQLALLRSGKRKMILIEGSGSSSKELRRTKSVESFKTSLEQPKCPTDAMKTVVDNKCSKVVGELETEVFVTDDTHAAHVLDLEHIETSFSKILEPAAQKTDLALESSHIHDIYDKEDIETEIIGKTNFLDTLTNKSKVNKVISACADSSEKQENVTKVSQPAAEVCKNSNSNFLDMLMNKVRVRNFSELLQSPGAILETLTVPAIEEHEASSLTKEAKPPANTSYHENEHSHSTDSCEEFLGFDDATERIPGMLLTPIVPCRSKSKAGATSSAFISESLNEYMRENNLLDTPDSDCDAEAADALTVPRHRQAGNLDGLVTPGCVPPHMQMPAVPESLQRLRTVAERRQYLQRFAKNHKMAIINNEATIYRELQRKIVQHKAKSVSQQLAQAPNSQMPFTRNGWQAASFCATEFNKYYYQMLRIDNNSECVKLPGVRGNNEERYKRSYTSRVAGMLNCTNDCVDFLACRDFKPIKTYTHKTKLNRTPLPAVFRPCPLSYKPLQRPLDDDTAALLLAGGSMAVVRMPTVELQVYPELGKPLHEIAKRYLQYILPHHDISREWAEFSVSTLQQPAARTMSAAAEEAAAAAVVASGRRKSFTFAIPYLNDRQHILVRRVVDRSEKLDQSFEQAPEGESMSTSKCAVTMADLTFRSNLDEGDELLMECADVLGDMINSVAISCSENSFIKEDPHSLHSDKKMIIDIKSNRTAPKPDIGESVKQVCNSSASSVQTAHNKKQNRLLCELRRLNATIIDAAAKSEKEVKPCSKDYCALGCVCASLSNDYPLRQHCGKSKCVIECSCKGLNQSRIMRLETDGRSITTEDAFMLRRKATARLARMEKEFTSTIVLTENETLLINESQYDKKRRCTKAPKRYEDFADTDDDFTRTPPKKSSSAVVTIDASEDNGYSEVATELREPIYVKDTTLEQLKHCTVSLVPFDEVKNMVVWCMVHELYKCYCGGRSTDGKPLFIEKEEVNTTTSDANNTLDAGYVTMAATKARYSFEKLEDENNEKLDEPEEFILPEDTLSRKDLKSEEEYDEVEEEEQQEEEEEQQEEEEQSIDEESEEPSSDDDDVEADPDVTLTKYKKKRRPQKHGVAPIKKIVNPKRGRPFTADIIQDYFKAQPNSCRRAVAVPQKTYARLNFKRLPKIYEYINANENAKTRLLLNEHILRSVYYHKHEIEKQRSIDCETKRNISDDKPVKRLALVKTEDNVVELLDEESRHSSVVSTSTTSKQSLKRGRKRKRNRTDQSKILSDEHPDRNDIERSKKRDFNGRFTAVTTSTKTTTTTDDAVHKSEPANKSLLHRLLREQKLTEADSPSTSSILSPVEQLPVSNIDSATIQVPKISGCFSLNGSDENVNNQLQEAISNSPTPSSQSIAVVADVTSATNNASTQSTARALGLEDLSLSNENFKEFYNGVIKNMNTLVSKKMHDIDMALKRESKVIPAPNNDILCIIKWSNFLDAFKQGFVFIWEVKMKDHSFFAATISNMMPMILGAMGVVNIAAMDAKKLPLMGRMLLESHRNENTWKLAIVMQGRTKYWLVKGFLRPDKSSACAKPQPQTHPILTEKINVLCSLLIKQRIKEYDRKIRQKQHEDAAKLVQNRPLIARAIPPLVAPISPTVRPQPQQQLSRTNNILGAPTIVPSSKKRNASSEDLNNEPLSKSSKQQISQQLVHSTIATTTLSKESTMVCHPQKRQKKLTTIKSSIPTNVAATSTIASPSNASLLRDLTEQGEFANMKTNIEFRKVSKDDIQEIYQPEFHASDHRWLVLDLYNDFSHIFVPDFRDLVSLDRIHKVMSFSRLKEKIVKLQFFQNAPFDAFVTPSSSRKIYFGPLKLNMRPPLLILLQSVDGRMMCREIYQKQHNIPSKPNERTTAFWILQISGQMHFEIEDTEKIDLPTPPLVPIATAALQQQKQPLKPCIEDPDPDSDEDCMIVEDDQTSPPERRSSEDLGQILPNSDESSMEAVSYHPIESDITTTFNTQMPLSPAQRINFTIKSAENASGLQITTFPNQDSVDLNSTPNAEQIITSYPRSKTTTVQSGSILQLPPNASQHSAGILPIFNLPHSAVITSTELAPKDAPYSSTIYISNLQSAGTAANQSTNQMTIYSNDLGTVTTPAVQPPILSIPRKSHPSIHKSPLESATATTTAAPIKQRRVSLRCPSKANNETTNIAIDVALKLIPQTPQESSDVVVEGVQEAEEEPEELSTHLAALISGKSSAAALNNSSFGGLTSSNISTIGCTTITKLLDSKATPGRTIQTAKLSLLGNGTEVKKTPAHITVEPISNQSNSYNSGSVYLNEITGEVEIIPSQTPASDTNNLQQIISQPVIKMFPTKLLMGNSGDEEQAEYATKSKRSRLIGGRVSIGGSECEAIKNNLISATSTASESVTTNSADAIKFPLTIPTKVNIKNSVHIIPPTSQPPVPPMVFDVNFMDSVDEPAASILIKQTSPQIPSEKLPISLPACTSITAKPTITIATATSTANTTLSTSPLEVVSHQLATSGIKRTVSGSVKLPKASLRMVRTMSANVSTVGGGVAAALTPIQVVPIGGKNYSSATTSSFTEPPKKKIASKSTNSLKSSATTTTFKMITPKSHPTATVVSGANANFKIIAPKPAATVVSATTSTQSSPQLISVTLPSATSPPFSLEHGELPTTQQLTRAATDALKVDDSSAKPQQRMSLPATVLVSAPLSAASTTTNVTTKPNPTFNVRAALPHSQRHSMPVKLTINKSRLSDTTKSITIKKPVSDTTATATAAATSSGNRSAATTNVSKVTTATAVTAATATATSATFPTAGPTATAEYGYFCCRLPNAPKFVGKRVRDDFLIKVPKNGIVRFSGGKSGAINTYLNQYMANKNLNFTLPVDWKFVTQDRLTMQGRKLPTVDSKGSDCSDSRVKNITIRRKLKASSNGTATSTTQPSAKAQANATAAASTNVHSDTILIED